MLLEDERNVIHLHTLFQNTKKREATMNILPFLEKGER
jgi:hypothetical protein